VSTRSPFRGILASAGTGKTWRLTGRFLELLFAGVAPERILATTFTRKAAGEIFDRVLRRLVDAAESDVERAALAQEVGRPLDAAEVRARLAALTRRLDRVRVRTLDAFFVHLARLFALDLGLPADWTIVEEAEDEALRREAVALALADAEPLELLEILRGLQQAAASRSVERVLLEKVREGRDAYLDSHPAAWSRITAPPGLGERELARAIEAFAALPMPTKKGGGERKQWREAHDKLLGAARAGDWRGVTENGLSGKVCAGETSYSGAEIDTAWREAIEALLRHAVHAIVADVVRENAAALRWLGRFEAAYEERKAEERAYRFEDLPKALHPRDERRLASQDLVWYRLDARIDHVLLDEFQDTAPVQWRVLANLAEEILADGTGERSFFCVGDVKQSIYGWREAEPRLLGGLHARYPQIEREEMDTSWRSSQVILDTVTRVFEGIADNTALADRPERREAALEFAGDFHPPRAARDLPGAAWLVEAPEGESEGDVGPAIDLAARRTAAILDQAPAATVGLLLRRNDLVPRLIHRLRREGVRASGEGGNPLTDSAAVLHCVSLLHLADHPGDSIAAFHVATSPLGPAVGLGPDTFETERAPVAAAVRARIAAEGLGAFCASLSATVAREYGDWDRKRFDQLVDLAHAFEDRAGLRADRFVDHLRTSRVEDPSAAQVKVMTIHAAKGLEFDAVILPELDVQFSQRETPLLTSRPDPAGLIEVVSHSRAREVCALDARPDGLGALWSEQKRRETREVLCLLYVAMTRARHRLDMVVRHRGPSGKVPKTFAGILRAALAPGRAADADGVLWRHATNDERWMRAERARGDEPAEIDGEPRAPRLLPGRAPRTLPRRTPSAEEGAGLRQPRALLRSPASPARLRGMLLHRFLQEVEWIEDFARTDEELVALGREITHERALLSGALADLHAALACPALRALLARPAGATPEVWRERPFAVVLPVDPGDPVEPGDGGREELWTGSFDRVVLYRRGGALERVELIDFKTDRVERDGLAERIALYRPQLASYRRVLARMSGVAERAIEPKLAFLHLDEVASLAD
jgi:ATP-dependent exoDNAse (exonuclease V) beta subunit